MSAGKAGSLALYVRGVKTLKSKLISTGIKEPKLEEGMAWAMKASDDHGSIYGNSHYVNHQLGHIALTWETESWNLAG